MTNFGTQEKRVAQYSRTNRHGVKSGQVHRLSHLLSYLQKRLDVA